jgi:hypothetical protein
MKMVEMAVLEDFVLGDRFLNGFAVKMANWVFDPRRRLNYMMNLIEILNEIIPVIEITGMLERFIMKFSFIE